MVRGQCWERHGFQPCLFVKKAPFPCCRKGAGCPAQADRTAESGCWPGGERPVRCPRSRVSHPYCAGQEPPGQITHWAEAVGSLFESDGTRLPLGSFPFALTVSVNCIRPKV